MCDTVKTAVAARIRVARQLLRHKRKKPGNSSTTGCFRLIHSICNCKPKHESLFSNNFRSQIILQGILRKMKDSRFNSMI